MTPAAQRALRDTALVHQVPGRFISKPSHADERVHAPQRSAMNAQLSSIIALLHRDPPLAPPQGADAVVDPGIDVNDVPGGTRIVAGDVKIVVWPYWVDGGRVVLNSGKDVTFWVNNSMCEPTDDAGSGLGFAFAPRPTGRFHGYPTFDSTVVITHRTAPPCVPVTREEFLTALTRKLALTAPSNDSEARDAKREQEAGLRQLAKTDPKGTAQLRVQLAQEQHVTDSITNSIGSRFTDALTQLSPAERASPAYLSENGCPDESNGCLVNANAAGARMVVRSNAAFFDSSRPADVQLITIDISHVFDDTNPPNPYLVTLMHSILDQLDWPALGALVR